jgi:hypothetical protein
MSNYGQGYDPGFAQMVQQLRNEIQQASNHTAGGLRKYTDNQLSKLVGRLDELGRVTSAMNASRSGSTRDPGVRLIEDIPGRRVPYVMLVDIPIAADTTSIREGSVTISQEGPFVAVRRMATFQSALEFQVTDPTSAQIARFTGRSFGRYRPIHSVCDINDSQHNSITDASRWYLAALTNPGEAAAATTFLPSGALSLPSNMSSFRSMEFDGRISVINAGSSYPRQNISVPSSFWSNNCNSPVTLGALDFFERGEVITVRVQPNHVNNPPAGNVDSDCIFPLRTSPASGGWPFVEGQYDSHEGICTPEGSSLGEIEPYRSALLATDAIARLPDGILTVAWEGYRIIQPVGPVG